MFNPGDVVCLKSNEGQEMTVRSIIDTKTSSFEQERYILAGALDGNVLCDWVDKSGKPQQVYYRAIELTLLK